jgi:acyl-coenzyme A thioesterase PaaI-like protein
MRRVIGRETGEMCDRARPMQARTHLATDTTLCGMPVELSEGKAVVALDATRAMAVDDRGLIHGGFIFGAADYAAMLAVNDPNVVLGAADVTFVAPVRVGDKVVATAEVTGEKGKKRSVQAIARVGDTMVFEGSFACFVLDRHVLDPKES